MSKKRGFRFAALSLKSLLSGLVLLAATGNWRPASTLAQLPAGTPTYNVNAKWVTDRGSQVYNVKAYGAIGNGSADDTTAINAAFTAAGSGGHILFPPGNYVVSSELNWATSNQFIEGYGAYILCDQSAASICVQIGDPNNANAVLGVTVKGLGFIPGPNSSTNSLIVDNAQGTHFIDIKGLTQSPSACSSQAYSYCHYGHFLENDNDQSETVDHLYGVPGATCTSAFCGSALYSPTGSTGGGITWLQNSDLSMLCSGNNIDWQSSLNHLTVSRSILQGWTQFALRTTWNADIDGDTHWEQGSCGNPLNDGNGHSLGGAGLIILGQHQVSVEGPSGAGGVNGSVFHTNASGGSSVYWYYVVGHTADGHVTAPLVAGWLNNGPATISGPSAVVYAVWPALTASGVTTFDLLRTSGTVPYGTGNYAVATGLAVGTYCTASSGQVCAFTDNVGTPSGYTIATESLYPGDMFWPGNLVIFGPAGSGGTNVFAVGSYSGPAIAAMVVNSAPSDTNLVHVNFTGVGQLYSGNAALGPGFIVEGSQYAAYQPPTAQLIPKAQPAISTKGVINLGVGGGGSGISAADVITISDSNFSKTLADPFKHPLWDAADSALCGDPPLTSGACLRGPTVSQYIGVLPDGSHWATRTYSTGIADAVPHYGFQTTSAGAPNTPTLHDESSATACLSNHYLHPKHRLLRWRKFPVGFVGRHLWVGKRPNRSDLGYHARADYTGWERNLEMPRGRFARSQHRLLFQDGRLHVGGCSAASSEANLTTANDSASHLVLLTGTAKAGHTSYQVGCSTTTGTEARLTAPWTGAYTGNGYLLPVTGCSGSGGFNASDQTGNGIGPAGTITQTIASGSLALATSSINTGACQTVTQGTTNSAAASGVVSTDTIIFTPNGSLSGVAGFVPSTSGGFSIAAYPTSGYVNFDVCNWTGSNGAPGAVTVNWRVTR